MGNYFAVPAPLLQIVSIEVGTKQEIGPRQIYVVGLGGKSVSMDWGQRFRNGRWDKDWRRVE